MIANEKEQSMMFMSALLRWIVLGLLFASAHAFAQSTGTVTYVYTDPQGTPLAEADASGTVTATFEYTPYGTYAPSGTSNPGPTPNGPGYTGHVNDPETNLVYMQARYYDPAIGRFLSADPIRPVAGNEFNFNRYAYVDNNPIAGIDPTGMEDECPAACRYMRRVSDWFSGIGSGQLGGGNGAPNRLLGQAQATTSYANGEVNEDLSTAAGAAAPVADAIPGMTLGACLTVGDCHAADWAVVALSAIPGDGEIGAEGWGIVADVVHGNSALSTRTAYLYRLATRDGALLKWGISYNPAKRYPLSVMLTKRMQIMTSGSRREMLNLERWIVERDPGELNHERWAGQAIEDGTAANGP